MLNAYETPRVRAAQTIENVTLGPSRKVWTGEADWRVVNIRKRRLRTELRKMKTLGVNRESETPKTIEKEC